MERSDLTPGGFRAVVERPVLLLQASNLIFLAGGVLAFYTRTSMAIVTAVALAAAVPALWHMKNKPDAIWLDRAASAAAGTLAVIATLIIIPYITIEEGRSLWSSTAYSVLMLAVASFGVLLWNAMALIGVDGDHGRSRAYAIFHVLAIGVAIYFVLAGDGESIQLVVRGVEVTSLDLRLAPAVASAPGVVWLLAWATQNNPSK